MDDVERNKRATIARCVARVREEVGDDPTVLERDITRQDSVILNIQRAAEAAIDLAHHRVRRLRLGIPQESRDAFRLLESAGHLDAALSRRLQAMVGFRNVAVHDYTRLNLAIVRAIIDERLDDLVAFAARVP